MTENQFSSRHTIDRESSTSNTTSQITDVAETARELPWNKRLHIIEKLGVSDKKATEVFKCSINTLRNAKQNETADSDVDVEQFASLFAPKKRGRKSQKVQQAFDQVTTTKVPLEQFCQQHGVSINTITQRKRFNREDICIAMNPETKVREIWRQEPHSED